MTEHYFTDQTSDFSPELITIRLPDISFQLYSAAGIFSSQKLDAGTKILLKYMKIPDKAKVLDLGCGYGIVGITVLERYPESTVTFVDTNPRATTLTKMNLKLLKHTGIVLKSNIFSNVSDKFDVILTNPPYSAGRNVCVSFIKESYDHLIKGGTLQLVCRRRKGGDFLEGIMNDIFGNVSVIGSGSGYRVYCSVR